MNRNQTIWTVFQRDESRNPALFSPSDTTRRVENFPKIVTVQPCHS